MVDSHLHLDDEKFEGTRQGIIDQLPQHNVDFVINNSCDATSMERGVELAQNNERVFATIGMHPHTAKDFDGAFVERMKQLATHPKVVAVGEIGLDYYYDLSDRQTQRDVFAQQLEIADSLRLPVTLHIRDAYGDAVDILRAQKKFLNNGVLWHCYGGSAELARQLVKLGHYFAFGGAITFKNANKAEVVRAVPISQVLTETDSPYMTPVPLRGTTNTPYNIKYVLEKLAEFYQKDATEVENAVKENCLRLFGKIAKYFEKK